ncbi:hypothetical protein [Agrobacterium radiobacter]|uniref:hypothetical protein n=1 Tax=Agrobacterium radiobacter TaxID=362 RepID=UPI003CE5618D
MLNQRDGITHDFTAKQGVVHTRRSFFPMVSMPPGRLTGQACGMPPELPNGAAMPVSPASSRSPFA